ncbi:Methicillin resistance protein, partial [mine drainage metagenome]
HVYGDPLQGWSWGAVKQDYGWEPRRFWVMENGRTVGSLALVRRTLPMFGDLLYAPRGPVLDPAVKRYWMPLRAELRRIFPDAFVLVAEPRIDEREKRPPAFWQGRRRGLFGGIQPRLVAEIPLTGADDLWRLLSPKCRYNVRLAMRRGLTVRRAQGPDRATFLRLLQITARRDGFFLRAPRFYAQVMAAFGDAGQGEVFLVERDQEALAGVFVICLGRHALFLYGASSDEHRRDMAPYLCQWHAIRWASANGAERYDMTGIAPNDNPDHPL